MSFEWKRSLTLRGEGEEGEGEEGEGGFTHGEERGNKDLRLESELVYCLYCCCSIAIATVTTTANSQSRSPNHHPVMSSLHVKPSLPARAHARAESGQALTPHPGRTHAIAPLSEMQRPLPARPER